MENTGVVKNKELLVLQSDIMACDSEVELVGLREDMLEKMRGYYKNILGSVCRRYGILVNDEKGDAMFKEIFIDYFEGLGRDVFVRTSFAGYLYGKIQDWLFRRFRKEEVEQSHQEYIGEYIDHNVVRDEYKFLQSLAGLFDGECKVSYMDAYLKFLLVYKGCVKI